MSQELIESLWVWMPELVMGAGAMAVVLVGVFFRRRRLTVAVAWLALFGAGMALWTIRDTAGGIGFFGLVVLDDYSQVARWLALGVVGLVALMAASSRDVEGAWFAEYMGLLFFAGVGLMLMAQANHLLMAYLALELVSISCYALVALVRDARSAEASLKYLLFGALSSGVMLFGMSLLFGLSRQMSFPLIRQAIEQSASLYPSAFAVAIVLVLVGIAFKISMVPFHMWVPDVYEGAPIPVAAMLSVGPKVAGIVLLLRLAEALKPMWDTIEPLVLCLTILTMTLGNVVAVVQNNVKRLLAYSTIGQVGYLLIGFAVNTRFGVEALLVYLVAYLFMNLGAFACVVTVCDASNSESLDAFRGLAYRSPALAFWCALFLLSLAGIPPLLGFVGKFLLFGSAIEADRVILAIAGVINSTIALYYYVNIIRQMYLEAPAVPTPIRPSASLQFAVGLCGMATIGLGLFPARLLALVSSYAGATLL